MKITALTALLLAAAATTASAKDTELTVRQAVNSADKILALLADSVVVGAVGFTTQACDAKFGTPGKVTGDDRKLLAGCLSGLRLKSITGQGGTPLFAVQTPTR